MFSKTIPFSHTMERFNTLRIKLILTVGAAIILILTGGFIYILQLRNKAEREDFIRELATITGYAESVREFLAEHQGTVLEGDSSYARMDKVPVIAAWRTAKRYSEGKGYSFKTPSLNPRNPGNRPDGFERRALVAFDGYPEVDHYYEEKADERLFRYAVPVRLTKDCLRCHGMPKGEPDEFGYPKEGMEVGDLKGAFSVKASMALLHVRRRTDRWILLWVGLATFIVITGILLFVVRRITSPLNDLVLATRSFSEGDLATVVPVRSGDEVGKLAEAFNDMAAKLKASYDGLEEKVEARTSELKRSQDQLLQAAKLAYIGELVGGIAHEINNPTGVIVMRASSLMKEANDVGLPKDILNDIEVIQRQSDQLAAITSGLLQFSRQSPFSPFPIDINRIVRKPISLIEPILNKRGIDCTLLLDDSLPTFPVDETRIEQVLLNLYNNAIDAMPGGGELTIRTRFIGGNTAESLTPAGLGEGESGNWVEISVRDTGEGIQSENLSRIFDPFFTTKEVGKGTGLGLSISYGIIQEHGGRIEVDSRWGHGSEFRMYLPQVRPSSPKSPGNSDFSNQEPV